MPTAKPLRHPRSQSPLPAPTAEIRPLALARSFDREQALPCLPRQQASWQEIAAGASRAVGEIVTRLTIHAEIAFPNFLLGVLSWAIAEFLAGCAAYGQALYCTPMVFDDRLELRDPEPAFSADRTKDRAKKPVLMLVSERTPGPDWQAASGSERARPREDAQAQIVELTPPVQTVGAPSRSYRTVVAPMMALLSRIHEARARHEAIMELNAFDDRALRDVGLSRSDIKAVVRRERVERCDPGPQR